MYQLVLVVHIFVAICLIALVMVQQGKGAVVGAAFGAGASQTVFGSRGAGSFMLKLTMAFLAVFFVTSISLNWMASHAAKQAHTGLPLPVRELLQKEEAQKAAQAAAEPVKASTVPAIPSLPVSGKE